MSKLQSYFLISLGCPKNLVDSTGMGTLLEQAGLAAADSPEEADLLVVNTCGFIAAAREESLATLQELARVRRADQRLVAAGCYVQRSPQDLVDLVPGLDGLIGTRRWQDVASLVERLRERPPAASPCHVAGTRPALTPDVPRVALQGSSAYLKLADGCRRSCSFCAIPLIKGLARSRPPAAVLADARLLAGKAVQEIILISQDTTDYGTDLGMKDGLAGLLERLVVEVEDVPWIRLMYAFPGRITERLIDTMARHPQVLPYLDVPLQHAHPGVLRRMRRPPDIQTVLRTIEQLRTAMPDIALRTTFLVGFPGETETEFQALVDFCCEVRFDRVGVFSYSHEEGTPAATLDDDVPAQVKSARRNRLMEIQQPISLARNQALVGATLDVLIEGWGDDLSVGRSYRDAPEVDGLVLAQADLPIGEIVPLRITAALDYDLVGEPA